MSEGFDTKKFEELYRFELNSFWFCSRNKLIILFLKKYFGKMKSFLEVGCGTGFVLSGIMQAFSEVNLHGSELFNEGLAYARKRTQDIDLVQMDVLNMDYINKYDVIGAFDVLEHIDDDETALKNLYNACRLGIIVTVPQHKFLWSKADELAYHVRRYTRDELIQKLEKAGFIMEYVSGFVSLLLPLMYVSRKTSGDVSAELDINPLINKIFFGVMAVERALLRLGVKFPFGGSLLVVAKKVMV